MDARWSAWPGGALATLSLDAEEMAVMRLGLQPAVPRAKHASLLCELPELGVLL